MSSTETIRLDSPDEDTAKCLIPPDLARELVYNVINRSLDKFKGVHVASVSTSLGNSHTGNVGDGTDNLDRHGFVPVCQSDNNRQDEGVEGFDPDLQFRDVRTLMFWNFIHSSVLSGEV